MTYEAVRDAYASMSQQYVAAFGGSPRERPEDVAFVERHLVGLDGPVLDLGCGPGQWTAHLHDRGVAVTGVDVVPEFIAHARATHPGPLFRLGSMTEVDVAPHTVAGILAWYSTIHLPPPELRAVLAGFRQLLVDGGVLVIGFFDSDDGVATFDHRVITAHRWPVEVMASELAGAGFTELQRECHQLTIRPDRRSAALAARAC